jgi:hypothetical protein
MKKNLLFMLSIFVLSISFVSCGNDDENDDSNSNTLELYLDNVKQEVSSISNIEYITTNVVGETQLKAYFYGGDGSQFTSFTMTFDNVKLSEINIGDNLISKNRVMTYYMLICDKGMYTMGDIMTDLNGNPIFVGYIGQAVVKSFDKTNNKMEIEFKDVKLADGKGNFINVKGLINSIIE